MAKHTVSSATMRWVSSLELRMFGLYSLSASSSMVDHQTNAYINLPLLDFIRSTFRTHIICTANEMLTLVDFLLLAGSLTSAVFAVPASKASAINSVRSSTTTSHSAPAFTCAAPWVQIAAKVASALPHAEGLGYCSSLLHKYSTTTGEANENH